MRTTVIVPPSYLVAMFGVPESVKLPTKLGGETVFQAHGKQFRVCKVSRCDFMLTCPLNDPRARFGKAREIAEDIGRVLESGALPHSANTMH